MSDDRWWVEAQDRAWGPYSAARLPQFVAEGRLGPGSRVGRDPAGPFAPAAQVADLAGLFPDAAEPEAPGGTAAASGSPTGPPGGEAREEAHADADAAGVGESRALLVLSDAPEPDLPALEAALRSHGEAVRIRPGLWLARAETSAPLLRNALSRGLRAGAMLLVVEAPLPAAAWFALEGETDRALRRLWAG